jgi:hypothetical protein
MVVSLNKSATPHRRRMHALRLEQNAVFSLVGGTEFVLMVDSIKR